MTPRLEERLLDVPTPPQVNKIVEAAVGSPHHAAVLLAAETGLRRSELLGLRWADIDLDQARASVKQTVFAMGREVAFAEPKTKRSRRTIGLTPRAVGALRRHRVTQSERRLGLGASWTDHDLVFDRGDGRPVHPDVFSRYFSRLIERHGLGRVRLHDLRHAFATNLMRTVGTKDTSAALGHTSEAFTMRVYQHVVPDVNADLVAEAISKIYGTSE